MASKRYTLNKTDLQKIVVGACITAGGAVLTYLAAIVGEIDFGVYSPFVVVVASVAINAGRKLLEGK